MKELERMLLGELYNPYKVGDNTWEKSRAVLQKFNSLDYKQYKKGMQLLKTILGHIEDDAVIIPPFYCDKGCQINIGKHFYANTDLLILDEANVKIGNNVFIAPRVSIYTASHPIDAEVRNMGLEYAKPVTIGNNVWIGGNVVINPDVTIEDNVVIGSGSVVTKSIKSNVIAAGNPCCVIREITDSDKQYWQNKLQNYIHDNDIS